MSINKVRYFDSQMFGAPSATGLSGAGKLISLFDACLVDGFNVNAIAGSITVAGGIATAQTAAAHNFLDYTVIRVWGCAEAGLNGDWKCTVPGGDTISWPTTVADGTYGGAISAKTAPLGWSKAFTAPNIAVYRPASGLRHYFRINDANAQFTYLRGYEAMTGSGDAGTQPFPTSAQVAAGVNIMKHQFSTAYAQRWQLFGDDKTVYLVFGANDDAGVLMGSGMDYAIYGFGNLLSYQATDVGNSFVAAVANTFGGSIGHAVLNGLCNPGVTTVADRAYGGFYISRPSSGVTGAPTRLRCAGSGLVSGWGSSESTFGATPSPNPADLATIFHHPLLVQEEGSRSIRGELRGLWQPLNTGSLAGVGSTVDVDGRKIMLVRGPDAGKYLQNTLERAGLIGIDITGPWS